MLPPGGPPTQTKKIEQQAHTAGRTETGVSLRDRTRNNAIQPSIPAGTPLLSRCRREEDCAAVLQLSSIEGRDHHRIEEMKR